MRVRAVVVAGAVTLAVLSGCSSDGDDSGDDAGADASTTTATAAAPKDLQILVTNDDGFAAEGIDVVVEALRKLPDVKITVSAPAENKSGTGSQTTPGTLTATEQATRSGYPATAVNGFPADAVTYGLTEVVTEPPDLVVSGINEGQNLGVLAAVSGTVGAAKAAVAEGIPALAASQGLGQVPDYPTAAKYVVDWVAARRDALLEGTASEVVVNLNVPTCTAGAVKGLKQEPLSATGNGISVAPNCTSTVTKFADDVEAFLAGFATATELDAEGQTVTSSTTWPAPG